jgi:hypothetical protein
VNFWPWVGLGVLIFGLGYVVGFVCGYETWVKRRDE